MAIANIAAGWNWETLLITVYTNATNGRDALREDQCTEGARFVAYVDQSGNGNSVWNRQPGPRLFQSPRRDARMRKILSHQFTDTEYSVWMDANVALKVPARQIIDDYLRGADLAVFLHRTRMCAFDEADRCAFLGADAADLIEEQVRHYERSGFRKAQGLAETSVVIRRHTRQVCTFNDAWWSELCRYSLRDQISFMYAVRKVGLRINFIHPSKYFNPCFSVENRPAGCEPV